MAFQSTTVDSTERAGLVQARLDDIEKFIAGRSSPEEADTLRRSTSSVEWFGWLRLKQEQEQERVAEVEALIAECTAPVQPHDGYTSMIHRNNRLLAAILRQLCERRL